MQSIITCILSIAMPSITSLIQLAPVTILSWLAEPPAGKLHASKPHARNCKLAIFEVIVH